LNIRLLPAETTHLFVEKFNERNMRLFFLMVALLANNVLAEIPSEYQAITVRPPFSFSERVFDITPVVTKAKTENKNIFVYLGAQDCPPCHEYSKFLKQNFNELKNDFGKVIFLELDTWLKGAQIVIRNDGRDQKIKEFFVQAGDDKFVLFYPSFWLITPDLKIVKKLPKSIIGLTTIEATRELLR